MPGKLFRIFLLVLFLFLGRDGYSQKNITVSFKNRALSEILDRVSSEYDLRFAFNDDVFSQIQTSLVYTNISIDDFLNSVCINFGLRYKYIGGTYVFYIDDELKVIEAINAELPPDTVFVEEEIPILKPIEREYTLSGVVKNFKTGEKLNYSHLIINGTENVLTNEMGFFSKTLAGNGEFNVSINHLGYYKLDTTIHLQNSIPLEILLHPIVFIESSKRFHFIDYIATMPEVPELVAFNPSTTIQVPAVESNDLVNALTIIPGVNYLKGTDTGLSIRGGAPSDNLVLIDGIPIIESSHLMGNLSVLNAKYIQQAFVSRGGFGAEYGGRTAGIVDLTGKSGNNIVPVVDFTANLLHTNIYVGLPINEKSSLSGSFKKSFVDVWPNYLIDNFALENMTIHSEDGIDGNAVVDETIVNYSDANVKLSIRPNAQKEITVNYFSSFDSQRRNYLYPIEGNFVQNNYSDSKTNGYSINFKDQRREGWLNSFTIGYNHLERFSEFEYIKDQLVKDQLVKSFFDSDDINLQELRASWKSEITGNLFTHKFGLGFNSNAIDYKYEDHEIKILGAKNFNDSISAKSQIRLANGYYQIQVAPLSWINFRGGVRSIYNINNGLFSLQPRYGIELIPFQPIKIYYSGGRYVQHMYLAYRIDSYKNASSIWFIPKEKNQNLDAIHHVLGTRFELNNLMLNVEAYRKVNGDKSYFIGDYGVYEGLKVVNYAQKMGTELNRGIDLFFQYRTQSFKHLISYSISESFEKIDNVNNNLYFPSFDHQLHRLRLTEMVSIQGWTASVNWYYASGTPFLLTTSTSDQLNFGQHNNFMQLDVSLVKQFNFKNFYADIGLTVLNVIDQRNEINTKNFEIKEGAKIHRLTSTTTATSFSPLFYINLRYE